MSPRRTLIWAAIALVAAAHVAVAAQWGGRMSGGLGWHQNVPYNGQFTFSRVRYAGGGYGGRSSAWNHDYPDADRHLPLILDALTAVRPNLGGSNILDLEDPEIFRQPILYMWEPGFWNITDEGATNLRDYMLKGGFVIFDDFEAGQWTNFEVQFRRALPDAQFIELDASHRVFHSFFEMETVNVPHPLVRVEPVYYGVFERNDPSRRMMALVNYNNDIAEYWEWSDRGQFPVDTTNDAYKLGVNYILYGLMH